MKTETAPMILPPLLSETISEYEWQQEFAGRSTAQVFRLEKAGGANLYLKTALRADSELAEEKQRLEWLAGKLSAPEVLLFEQQGERDYLLISEIEGAGAHEDFWKSDVKTVIEQLAKGLKTIHGLPIEDCPFDARLRVKIEQARGNVERNLVDESDFDEERAGWTAADLFQELIGAQPATEDLVFTHGDYCLPNVILKDWRLGGFVDWGRAGIADKYQDIALLARSVERNFGAQWLPVLFETLKIEPDFEKLRFYALLDEFF